METALLGLFVVFVLGLLTGIAGLFLLPAAWSPVLASVVGVAGLGLGVTGYAIVQD